MTDDTRTGAAPEIPASKGHPIRLPFAPRDPFITVEGGGSEAVELYEAALRRAAAAERQLATEGFPQFFIRSILPSTEVLAILRLTGTRTIQEEFRARVRPHEPEIRRIFSEFLEALIRIIGLEE